MPYALSRRMCQVKLTGRAKEAYIISAIQRGLCYVASKITLEGRERRSGYFPPRSWLAVERAVFTEITLTSIQELEN